MLRRAWWLVAFLSVGILLAALPGYLTGIPFYNLRNDLVFELSLLERAMLAAIALVSIFSALFSFSLAALLYAKIRRDRMGLFLSYYLLFHGVLFAGPIELLEPIWPGATRINSFVLLPLLLGPGTAALIGLFPDGRFVPRWSPWLIVVSLLLVPLSALLGAAAFPMQLNPAGWTFLSLASLISIAVIVGLLYVPYYRYRYVSTAEQRQQTKWVVLGIFLVILFQLLSGVPWTMALNLPAGAAVPWWVFLASLLWIVSTTFIPITLTIAVMRYRLYEIDSLLSRTLVYTLLTGALGVVYFLSITLLQQIFETESRISAVLSTLAIAVLFRPLRVRLQEGIDKRFNRRRYDADLTLAAFSAALRREVDLEKLSGALLTTTEEALQPSSSSLWLRKVRKVEETTRRALP